MAGDSGTELKRVLSSINQPALFWLDGHYSAGNTAKGTEVTPIYEELEHIFAKYNSHVILIDDARCFGEDQGYPSLDAVKKFIGSKRTDLKISVKYDCIRVEPD